MRTNELHPYFSVVPENCQFFIGSFMKPNNSLSSIHHTTPLISSVIGGHFAQNIDHFIAKEKIGLLHSVKPVASVRFYLTHTALHLDEYKIIFWTKYNNQIVYNLQFLDVFPGYHQISIASQEGHGPYSAFVPNWRRR